MLKGDREELNGDWNVLIGDRRELASDGVKEQRKNDKKQWGGVEEHFIKSNIAK